MPKAGTVGIPTSHSGSLLHGFYLAFSRNSEISCPGTFIASCGGPGGGAESLDSLLTLTVHTHRTGAQAQVSKEELRSAELAPSRISS